MEGVSEEYIGAQEDRIARMITASQQVSNLRRFLNILEKREKITKSVYEDACDSLTFIDGALLDGKQAIVALRNARCNL